jgi:DNA-binding NarL/FixJ family response regulator
MPEHDRALAERMRSLTTVLICADHRLLRDSLQRQVLGVPGIARVLTAVSGRELLARWPRERPDLALVDVRLRGEGGLETVRRLLARHPEAAVIILADVDGREHAARAIAHGARGYLRRDPSRAELCAALATVSVAGLPAAVGAGRGSTGTGRPSPDTAHSNGTLRPVRKHPSNRAAVPHQRSVGAAVPALTERERQVLEGMSEGRSNAEIGRALFLSEDTVKTHARRLFRKLGVTDRAQAVAVGFRAGLVE